MSYILDALKKSDQQRQHARTPTLLTSHAAPAETQARSFAINAWRAFALIGLGLLIGWWRPWAQENADPGKVSSAIPIPVQSPVTGVTPRPPASPAETPIAALPRPPSQPPSPAQPPDPLPRTERSADTAVAKPVAQGPAGATPKPADDDPAPQLQQLPPEIQQSLPTVTIAFHQYASQPENSRVMINNRVLKAGDVVAPGLTLERITADGVELAYQGYRFRRGVR